jgi:DNA-binding NtrC family response regulator
MASAASVQRGIEFSPRSGKVLVVDENHRDLDTYRMLLGDQGFMVLACSSFESAVRYLDAERFDFVLVSQGSRAFEGRIVIERAMYWDRHRAVLVVTNCMDMDCYLEAMQMGAVDYVEKPLSPSDLLRFVQVHIQAGRLKEQETSA